MDRRRFLQPQRIAEAAGHVLGMADELAQIPLPTVEDTPEEHAFVRLGWRAMATSFEMLLPLGTPDHLLAGRDGFELLDSLEDQLTVYRESSEVSRLNRHAPRRAVRVESGLFDLLELSRQIHTQTDGAFDITLGALIKAWGFFRGPRRVPADEAKTAALASSGMANVALDADRQTVRFLVSGLEINLGSIGKGYALDRVADRLSAHWGIRSVLMHGGCSSVVTRGDAHGDGRGWAVRVRHPVRTSEYLAEVRLHDQALGTSAATFQHLWHQGRRLGHILDPRTGWPATGIASASVVAPTGALADALSTAFYVGGVDVARRYCDTHSGIGAIVLPEGASTPLVFGMDANSYTLLNQSR